LLHLAAFGGFSRLLAASRLLHRCSMKCGLDRCGTFIGRGGAGRAPPSRPSAGRGGAGRGGACPLPRLVSHLTSFGGGNHIYSADAVWTLYVSVVLRCIHFLQYTRSKYMINSTTSVGSPL
jgi:hypothetical protein